MQPQQKQRGRQREPRLYDDEVGDIKARMIDKCGSLLAFYELVATEAKLPEYRNFDPPKKVETIDRTFDDAFSSDPNRRRSLPKVYWKVLEKLLQINRASLGSQATAEKVAATKQESMTPHHMPEKEAESKPLSEANGTAIERKLAQDELCSNSEKLAALQIELLDLKKQEEITRTRGEIYSSLLHSIHGPLTIISGFVQIINQRMEHAKRLEGEDLALVKDRLRRITRQLNNCIEISHRYPSFMGQQPTVPARIHVNQIFEDLRELLHVHPSKGGNTLKIQALASDVELQINGTDLIQILLNLANNALECTAKPHLVDISGQILESDVDFSTLHDGPTDRILYGQAFANTPPLLRLVVRDDGPGIPPDVLPRIFQPYVTSKAAAKHKGMGLTIVSRLLKEVRGCMHMHSEPGKGTTFNIYLPASVRRN